MKKCTTCGRKNKNGAKYCDNCGALLETAKDDFDMEPLEQEDIQHFDFDKKNGKLPVILLAVIACCVMATAFFAAMKTTQQPKEKAQTEKEVVTESQDAQEIEEENVQAKATTEATQQKATTQAVVEVQPEKQEDNSVSFSYYDDYIFPQSSSEYLTESDLYGLSAWELKIARNEIYARNGREFTTDSMREYFQQFSWYHASISAEAFDKQEEAILNKYEKVNRDLIISYEAKNGK